MPTSARTALSAARLSTALTWPSLRPGARLLAVEVQVRAGDARAARRRVGQRADQVDHAGRADAARRAERQAGDGAQVVLELARLARPRSSSGRSCGRAAPSRWRAAGRRRLEQLDRQHADVVELARARGARVARPAPRSSRRDAGAGASDRRRMPLAVVVLDQRVEGDRAVATAHGEDRQLAVERHERRSRMQRHAGRASSQALGQRRRRAQHDLALAVVAERAAS